MAIAATGNPGRQRLPWWQAFAAALGAEAATVVLLVAWIGGHPPQLEEHLVPLVIEPLAEERPQAQAEPERPRPVQPPMPRVKPVTQVERLAPPPMRRMPLPAPLPLAQSPTPPAASTPAPSLELVATPVVAAPAPLVKAAVPTLPVPVPVPAAADVDPSLAYNAKLAAAVQAAFEVPAAASALNFKGRARLEFNLMDGVATGIRVVQSSGLSAADRAAVKAVQSAAFPLPPPTLQGKDASYQIWVACL